MVSSFWALAERTGTTLCSASAAQLEAKDIVRIKKGRYKASDRVKSFCKVRQCSTVQTVIMKYGQRRSFNLHSMI